MLNNYKSAIDYLTSLIRGPAESPLTPQEIEGSRGIRLPRVKYFLELLGNPHDKLNIIHVGGTSGKGSVSTMISEILIEAGYKVGLHTTPYLQSPTEKLEINHSLISMKDFIDLVDEVKPFVSKMEKNSPYDYVRYGEVWVGMTLLYFAKKKVDWAVIEVGKGGRYDSTNIVSPRVTAITTVDKDHILSLGPTIADIAFHKAGIIKHGIPILTSVRRKKALETIINEATQKKSPIYIMGQDFGYVPKYIGNDGNQFDYLGIENNYELLKTSMLGSHQIQNATLSIATIEILKKQGVFVKEEFIRKGVLNAKIPGRFEVMQRDPIVVLDGAHNEEKIQSLKKTLKALFGKRKIIILIGIIQSKDYSTIIKTIAPLSDLLISTEFEVIGKPAVEAKTIAECASKYTKAIVGKDPISSLKIAMANATKQDVVCVTGSIYLLGQIRDCWFPTENILIFQNKWPVNKKHSI